MQRQIAIVTAGLGQPSSTRLLAERLGEATTKALNAHELNANVHLVELRDLAHEIIDTMLVGFPAANLREVLAEITRSDALIAVSPLFTTTYSGLFKSFVDIMDPEDLAGMPVLLGATGGTPRHSLALEYSMRPLFTYLHADVVTTSVFAATDDWAGAAEQELGLPRRIELAGRELAALVAGREPRGARDEFANTPSFEDLLGQAT